jgi:HEAT repeat protein
VTSRLSFAILLVAATALPAASQAPGADLKTSIDRLSNFDYSIRMNAARALRRMPSTDVVPALTAAARSHTDQFVRYRALVLLTSFRDASTGALMRALLPDRNDRVREVAYRWFEDHPDPAVVPALLAALETEQSEFVRPALVRALAAHAETVTVQRALVAEAQRGLDFFRSAVIEALGKHRAAYAADTIATVIDQEGPLQDDAILALGRIGDRDAVATLTTIEELPAEAMPARHAALCLLEQECPGQIAALVATLRNRTAAPLVARAATAALGAIAEAGNDGALDALFTLGQESPARREEVAVGFASAAIRQPSAVIAWLERGSEETRTAAIEMLRSGFESLEEDYAEEQFFASVRAAYWVAPEASATRTLAATVIDRLEF